MPSASLTTADFRQYFRFVGKTVLRLLALGTIVGLLLFIVEIAFAYVLQAFLLALGVASPASLRIPSWVPQGSLSSVVVALLAIGVVRGLLYWAQQYLPNATLEQCSFHQRARILHWVFQSKTVSSARSMSLFNEVNNGTAFALMAMQSFLVAATSAVLLAAALFFLSPQLSLVVSLLLLVLVIPLRRMDKYVVVSSNATWAEWSKSYAVLLASIKNLLLVQIYGTQDVEEEKVTAGVRRYRDMLLKHWLYTGLKFALPQVFGVFAICLIALATRRIGSIPSGILVSYFYLLIRFVQSLAGCAQHSSAIVTYMVPLKQLYAWWKDESIGAESPRGASVEVLERRAQAASRIEIDTPIGWQLSQVTYRYPGAAEPVLTGLDLEVVAGQALVILGPSGAGKSTLLNLILGQLEPDAGEVDVRFNGGSRRLRDVRSSVLSAIGYVGPESFLIEGTVRANLLYGLSAAPAREEIDHALELAGCQFVHSMPKGLEHQISEQGTGLSAGQKQRLSLARALLRRPRALILDEATSNLDNETELKLVRTLGEIKGKMTLVAVTHRQSLLEIADRRFDL